MLHTFDPAQSELFINETSPLMTKVRFGTVIPCIGGEMQEDVIHFGKISENLHILCFFVGLQPPDNFKTA